MCVLVYIHAYIYDIYIIYIYICKYKLYIYICKKSKYVNKKKF